jgi:hypothetical protein
VTRPEPLCHAPMRRYERPGRPVFDDPVCGRRENHPGPHRSVAAVARARRADEDRFRDRGIVQLRTRRRTARLHETLTLVVTAASEQARQAALAPPERQAA